MSIERINSIMNKAVIASILVGGIWGISVPSVPSAVAQTLPTVQPTAATANPVKTELLQAGVEPRRELRFRPTINSKQSMTMTMGMSMEMTVGETPIPKTPIPKMLLKIDALVRQIDPSGDIHCSFGYSDMRAIAAPDTSPEILAAMQKSLKSMVGTKIDLVIGSNGQIKSKNLSLPKNIDPTIKQSLSQLDRSMEQLSTPLPVEKIGLGGKWRVNNSIQVAGIKFDRSSTYEVVEIDDRGMTVKATISQSAPPQALPMPGAAKEAKGEITSLVSSGEGKYAIRFDSLLPLSGNSSSKTDSKTTIQVSEKEPPTNMSSKISIDLNISSK
jgi:hypothetical protein